MKKILVIPSLKPDEKLPALIRQIINEGYVSTVPADTECLDGEDKAGTNPGLKKNTTPVVDGIIVVDDGSGSEYAPVFVECKNLGCFVLTHEINLGKGAALKYAATYILENFGSDFGMLTADSDGQHTPFDIAKVARDMDAHTDALILGSRELKRESTPIKSYLGNRITSGFFRLTCGRWVRDTQTGLRGIPPRLMKLAATEEGDRYEYEMNFLMDAALEVPFIETPIATVYENNNKGSHFRPLQDGARVYGRFLRFLASSLTGFVVDIVLFTLLVSFLPESLDWIFDKLPSFFTVRGASPGTGPGRIVVATIIARICSGAVNFLFNKYVAFKSTEKSADEAKRYLILFICQMMASAFFTSIFNTVLQAATAAKIIVDFILFFISYRIQRAWVFRKKV